MEVLLTRKATTETISRLRYGATTLQANTWYHVTGVYNAAASELHVYLNGQLDDGAPLAGSVQSFSRKN